jgi:hypothetical protein
LRTRAHENMLAYNKKQATCHYIIKGASHLLPKLNQSGMIANDRDSDPSQSQ